MAEARVMSAMAEYCDGSTCRGVLGTTGQARALAWERTAEAAVPSETIR
jgi:hypothetical protein